MLNKKDILISFNFDESTASNTHVTLVKYYLGVLLNSLIELSCGAFWNNFYNIEPNSLFRIIAYPNENSSVLSISALTEFISVSPSDSQTSFFCNHFRLPTNNIWFYLRWLHSIASSMENAWQTYGFQAFSRSPIHTITM